MSATGVAISCAVGAGASAWGYVLSRSDEDQTFSLLLTAQMMAVLCGALAVLVFVFAVLMGGASPVKVLLAELPSWQLRKGVYLFYGCFTASTLLFLAHVARSLHSSRGEV